MPAHLRVHRRATTRDLPPDLISIPDPPPPRQLTTPGPIPDQPATPGELVERVDGRPVMEPSPARDPAKGWSKPRRERAAR